MVDVNKVPTLLCLVGASAVGKMTVGREVEARTGLRLFYNHASIEPILPFFSFGEPAFNRLVTAFRMGIFEEVAASGLPGLIFTFVWAFDLPSEEAIVAKYSAPFRKRGGRVLFAELTASLDERLRRNRSALRLAEKPSKRDLEASEQRLLQAERKHTFSSNGRFDGNSDWMRVDVTTLPAEEAARAIIERFSLA